jgi:hypothetical protein
MDENNKSLLANITSPGISPKVKKNIIISDLSRDSFELSKKIMHIFSEYETKIIFYSEKNKHFMDADKVISGIEELLSNASLIFNFISVKKQEGRNVSRIVEKLDINSIQNTLSTRMVFSAKNNIKSILEVYKFKTPYFELIANKNAEESFSNFTQPSRIFSAQNNFFSKKLDTLEKIQSVYKKEIENIGEYFIEEYLEGKDIYSFVFVQDDKIIVYNIEKKEDEYIPVEEVLNAEVLEYSKKMFLDMGIEKFALINIKKTERRGMFVLNIFVDLDMLMKEQGKILEAIFKKESQTTKEVLHSFLV